MYNRPYRFEFSDTASPENWTLLSPDFVILCYDINDRRSLINAKEVWRKSVAIHHEKGKEEFPVMLLGLKRDLRAETPGMIDPQEVRCVYFLERREHFHEHIADPKRCEGLPYCAGDAL